MSGTRGMKSAAIRIAAIALLLCSCHSLAGAQEKSVDLADGGVEISFAPPSGFRAFTEEEMASLRSKGVPAKFGFYDTPRESLIMINIFSTPGVEADESSLSEFKKLLEAKAEKDNPQIVWITQGFVTMSGKKWLHLQYKSSPAAGDNVDNYYVTDWAGRFVVFNFSTVVSKCESYQSAFEKSANSIQLGFIAESLKPSTAPVKNPNPRRKRPY